MKGVGRPAAPALLFAMTILAAIVLASSVSKLASLDVDLVPDDLSAGVSLHGAPGVASSGDRLLQFGGGLTLSSYRGEGCALVETSRLERIARRIARRPAGCEPTHHGALAWRFSLDYEAHRTTVWSHALRLSFLRGLGRTNLAAGAGLGVIDGGVSAQLETSYDLRSVFQLAWPRVAMFLIGRIDSAPTTNVTGLVGLRFTLDTPRG